MKAVGCVIALVAAIAVTGCSTKGIVVGPSSPGDLEKIRTAGIDPQDVSRMAEAMVGSINASGVLAKTGKEYPIVLVGAVRNETLERQLNVDSITQPIMAALSHSAHLMINRGIAADGRPIYEDLQGAGIVQRQRFTNDTKRAIEPDFRLSGEVSSSTTRDRKAILRAYAISLQLAAGEQVAWQDRQEIVKIAKR